MSNSTAKANWMKTILLQKNMTATELSRLTGITKPMISDWLRGKKRPSDKSLSRISQATGVSTFKLHELARTDNRPIQLARKKADAYEEMINALIDIIVLGKNPRTLTLDYRNDPRAEVKWTVATLNGRKAAQCWLTSSQSVDEMLDRDAEEYVIAKSFAEIEAAEELRPKKTSPAQRISMHRRK